MSTASDGEKIYGWRIIYLRHDGTRGDCHYVGSLATAKRKAMLRPLASMIERTEAFSEQQWKRTFGSGRM